MHEHGYQVEMDEQQRVAIRDRRGRMVVDAPPRPAPPGFDWAVEAPRPMWDGEPVDYELAVAALVE
jgi:hypothetical protein